MISDFRRQWFDPLMLPGSFLPCTSKRKWAYIRASIRSTCI